MLFFTIQAVPKFHNVYTSSYIRHRTVQCKVNQPVGFSKKGATSSVAYSLSSNKLYIYVSTINASSVSSVSSVSPTGSPDPTHANGLNKPCIIGGESGHNWWRIQLVGSVHTED